jgi:hypothetical protein
MPRYETPDVFEPEDEESEPNVSYQSLIAISADSLSVLRKIDVRRVIGECLSEHRAGLADWIAAGRPDLAAECAECLADL